MTSRLPRGYHVTAIPYASMSAPGCIDSHCVHFSYTVTAPFPRPSVVSFVYVGPRMGAHAYLLCLNTGDGVKLVTLFASAVLCSSDDAGKHGGGALKLSTSRGVDSPSSITRVPAPFVMAEVTAVPAVAAITNDDQVTQDSPPSLRIVPTAVLRPLKYLPLPTQRVAPCSHDTVLQVVGEHTVNIAAVVKSLVTGNVLDFDVRIVGVDTAPLEAPPQVVTPCMVFHLKSATPLERSCLCVLPAVAPHVVLCASPRRNHHIVLCC